MGKKSRQKRHQAPDPGRAERIKAIHANDRLLSETFERSLRLAKELGDRGHYDRLSKELSERCRQIVLLLPDLLNQWIAIAEPCFLANHALERECETLQDELDRLEGRPPRPDPAEALGPALAQLPAEQIAAVRYWSAVSREPAPPAPESTDAHDKAHAYVEDFENKLADLRKDGVALFEVAEESVRRGWKSEAEVSSRRTELEKYLQQIEGALPTLRDLFRSSLERYQALQGQRQSLREALARVRESSQK